MFSKLMKTSINRLKKPSENTKKPRRNTKKTTPVAHIVKPTNMVSMRKMF